MERKIINNELNRYVLNALGVEYKVLKLRLSFVGTKGDLIAVGDIIDEQLKKINIITITIKNKYNVYTSKVVEEYISNQTVFHLKGCVKKLVEENHPSVKLVRRHVDSR